MTAIAFEHSPGRADPRFTADGSAFDVFVAYASAKVRSAFVGIEVKYSESLDVQPARHRPRYEAIADAMGVFIPSAREHVRQAPLEQLWRDHLLAGSLALDWASGFDRGTFAVIYPSGNTVVGEAVDDYRGCLSDASGVRSWTLEAFVDAVEEAGAGSWAREVSRRYLGIPEGGAGTPGRVRIA